MDFPFLHAAQQVLGPQSSQTQSFDVPFLDASKQAGITPYKNPDDVAAARTHTGDQSFNDLCERFVEQMAYGKTGMYGSAADAWNSYVKNGQAQGGMDNIQPGNLVYFSPDHSNHNFGHTAIYAGNGNIIGATSQGIETMPIDQWQQMTGQQILGNVTPQK